jgi:outer membrane receptor protein involved in Fe transport
LHEITLYSPGRHRTGLYRQPAGRGSLRQRCPLLPLSLEELIATPVITASRRQEGREQTPAHIMVITREQMRDRRYKNLADLLEDLPGVDFQRGTRSAQYNNFAFQGHISNNKLLIMLDGVRIDHPAGGKLPIAENFGLYMARQVEVLYGPAAALYGADAAAGVINIITDKRDSPGGKIALGTGSFASHEGNFMVGGKLADRVSLSVGAHQQRSDRATRQLLRQRLPQGQCQYLAGHGHPGQPARELRRRHQQQQPVHATRPCRPDDQFLPQPVSQPDQHWRPHRYAVYDANNFWDTTLETWSGKYRFDISPSLSGETVVDYSTYEIDPGSRYVNVFTDFQNHGYDYSHARRRGIEQSLNWRVNDRHTVLAGIGYRDYFAIETPDLPQPYNRSAARRGRACITPTPTTRCPSWAAKSVTTTGPAICSGRPSGQRASRP